MTSGFGFRESGFEQARRRVRRPLRAAHGPLPSPRPAFTLVELLVVIAIIGILSSMLLGAASLSMGTARQSRTDALVTRLHTLLTPYYDTFRTRRVEVSDTAVGNVTSAGVPRTGLARTRLLATREQMKMELPDRWSDITLAAIDPNSSSLPQHNPNAVYPATDAPQYLETRPAMSRMYLRRYNRLAQNGVSGEDLLKNQGAECLYMIIMLAAGDGESAGLFKESEIGDTDGDGAPEFLDAWGNPIQFLRWAPGFDSEVQLDTAELNQLADDAARADVIAADRDPFDLFRVDRYSAGIPRGFRTVPLIYSAGADQEFGLEDGTEFAGQNATTRNAAFSMDITNAPFEQVSDPYLRVNGNYLGQITDRAAATDNVHNHYIEGR